MNQSNWIGAILVVGFIAYIIANNQLPGYLDVLGLSGTSATNQASTTSSNSGMGLAASTAASTGLATLEGLIP